MRHACLIVGLAVLLARPSDVTSRVLGDDHRQVDEPRLPTDLFDVDYRALVSRADLIYESPVAHPVEGQAVGNGVMGTMVWTTADAIWFQINRTDVFATNNGHTGPDEWRAAGKGPVDYGGGLAQVSLNVGGEPFRASPEFLQRLSLYDAEVSLAGRGVRVQCYLSAAADVLVIEVDDQRPEPQPVRLTVSMWREPEVRTGQHVAKYRFHDAGNQTLVVQQFSERDYYCGCALAAGIAGEGVRLESSTDRTRTLVAAPQPGRRTILVTTAASWAATDAVGAQAAQLLDQTAPRPDGIVRNEHRAWWHAFWSRTFLHAHSPDGLADFMERVRHLHLYYMASSSRGPVPPKWNGSIFVTDGDVRAWGSQYWVWTTEALYFPLFAADASDLTEPYFGMYVRQLPACRQAARQRWGAQGAFFPETTPFDGPVVLPEDVVAEYREVFSGRQDPRRISARLREICSFESHLHCSTISTHTKQYSWISHVASSGAELAVQAWWRYRSTGDAEFLRTTAYPLLRDTAEFYRSFAKPSRDGHNAEDVWLTPVFPFEDWTLETRDPASDRIVKKLVQTVPRFRAVLDGAPLNTAIRTPLAAVRADCGEQLPASLASYYAAFGPIAKAWACSKAAAGWRAKPIPSRRSAASR
jgi:hypothetical protein